MRILRFLTIFALVQYCCTVTAFAVDDGAGNEIIADNNLRMTNTGAAKQLQIQGSSTGFSTFQSGTNAGDINYTLPTTAPTVNQVLSAGAVTATTLIWATSSASTLTLQNVYDNDAGAPADIGLTSTDGGIALGNTSLASGSMLTMNQSNAAASVIPLTITNTGVGDALNVTHSSATAGNVFDFSADGTLGGTDDMVMDRTGNVGIGDITPSSKLEIGDGTDSIQFSSVGDITFVDADGAASITGSAGGTLTINSASANALTLDSGTTGSVNLGTGASAKTVTIGNSTSTSSVIMNSGTTGITASSTATTGTGMAVTTNSISSGNGVSITSNSTAAASNTQTLLNVALSGANGTSAQTTYGAQISNAHTGTTSTNVGLQVSASGGTTNNYALIASSGSVGIGTTTPGSTLHVAGSFQAPITSKTTTYTATASDYTITCSASGGAFSVNLPTASGISGRMYVINKTDSTANAVTVDGNASETIAGATTYTLTNQFEAITIQSDGTNWQII